MGGYITLNCLKKQKIIMTNDHMIV